MPIYEAFCLVVHYEAVAGYAPIYPNIGPLIFLLYIVPIALVSKLLRRGEERLPKSSLIIALSAIPLLWFSIDVFIHPTAPFISGFTFSLIPLLGITLLIMYKKKTVD